MNAIAPRHGHSRQTSFPSFGSLRMRATAALADAWRPRAAACIALLAGVTASGVPRAEAVPFRSAGNEVHFLETGEELNQKRLEIIQSATRFVYVKTFILNDDPSEFPVLDALCARAQAGVDVRMLLDDLGVRFGGHAFPAHGGRYSYEGLRACGIRVGFFSPLTWGLLDFALYRQHDKLLVTDSVAIVGGTNYSRDYSAHGQLSPRWYDLDISIQGPSACDVQQIFNRSWRQVYFKERTQLQRSLRETSDLASLALQLSRLYRTFSPETLDVHCSSPMVEGGVDVQVLHGNPYFTQERPFRDFIEQSLNRMIEIETVARMSGESAPSVDLYAPYFVPSRRVLAALVTAAEAGVKIRVITNSASSIDPEAFESYVAMLQRVEPLLKAGVSISLWNPSSNARSGLAKDNVFHKKGGCFGTLNCFVGSHNLDVRGDEFSAELMAVLTDPALISDRRAKVEEDLAYTVPLTLETRRELLKDSRITSRMIATLTGWAF